jgi:hypothetical protein
MQYPVTNATLQGLKSKQERLLQEQNIVRYVTQISREVCDLAVRTGKTIYINNSLPTGLFTNDLIHQLYQNFPEAKIDYIPENKLTGGRAVLTIDWS